MITLSKLSKKNRELICIIGAMTCLNIALFGLGNIFNLMHKTGNLFGQHSSSYWQVVTIVGVAGMFVFTSVVARILGVR